MSQLTISKYFIMLILALCLCGCKVATEPNLVYGDKVKVVMGFYSGQFGKVIKSEYSFPEFLKTYKLILENGEITNFIPGVYLEQERKIK